MKVEDEGGNVGTWRRLPVGKFEGLNVANRPRTMQDAGSMVDDWVPGSCDGTEKRPGTGDGAGIFE